ncbi:hypothetical protein D3C75_1066200 [compost metagenome]
MVTLSWLKLTASVGAVPAATLVTVVPAAPSREILSRAMLSYVAAGFVTSPAALIENPADCNCPTLAASVAAVPAATPMILLAVPDMVPPLNRLSCPCR